MVVVVTLTSFGLTIGLNVERSGGDIRAQNGFGPAPAGFLQFQEHACPCRTDWPVGTTERLRSNEVFAQMQSIPDSRNRSAPVPFLGQLIDHDVVLSRFSAEEGAFSIPMTPFDVFLNVTRSEHRVRNGCREPRNLITPLIDGTVVYGDALSGPDLLLMIRDGALCELRMQTGNMLPAHPGHAGHFLAGDERVTEHSMLTALHTVLAREHNRLCGVLRGTQPDWTETDRFWKARQIVVAKMQKITYEEWLPTLLGSQLWMLNSGPGYKPQLRERIVTEWSVSAFRFGHTMIPDPLGPFALQTLFFNYDLTMSMGVEAFLQAAFDTTAQAVDAKVVDGLRNFLFSTGMGQIGEDLVTRNLFRARETDQGTYPEVAHCYGSMSVDGSNEQELYIGLLQEEVVEGSSLPLNIAVIVAEQFRRLREFDPNFYTRLAQSGRLGTAYEAELQRTTMRTLLEDNTALVGLRENLFVR